MPVYQKVRAYIDENGLKQVVVAKKAGIPVKTFNAIMNGKRTFYADDLRAVCVALNVSPETFISVDTCRGKQGGQKGSEVLGCSSYKTVPIYEAMDIVKEIADVLGKPTAEVDYILWSYCAKGYGDICTKSRPMCCKCVAKNICNSEE